MIFRLESPENKQTSEQTTEQEKNEAIHTHIWIINNTAFASLKNKWAPNTGPGLQLSNLLFTLHAFLLLYEIVLYEMFDMKLSYYMIFSDPFCQIGVNIYSMRFNHLRS